MSEKKTSQPTPAYLWFDTEFTSLDTSEAHVLQVALVVTDTALNRLFDPSEDINLCVRLDPGTTVSPWVRENLGALLERCASPEAVPLPEADARLAEMTKRVHAGAAPASIEERAVLAGNSVYMDLALAKRLLPAFAAGLHYRLLDVSAIKTVWTDWGVGPAFDKESRADVAGSLPDGMALPASGEHDALYDVFASIAELNYYRRRLTDGTLSGADVCGRAT